VKEVHPFLRTAVHSVSRRFFTQLQFTEISLPSHTSYKIEGVRSFKVAPGMYLRYTPEPDAWIHSEGLHQFFWIGSIFRNNTPSPWHSNEFSMVACYARSKTTTTMVSVFFALLREIEQTLEGHALSKAPLRYATYAEFNSGFDRKHNGWVVVTEYPKEQSFYDQMSAAGNTLRYGIYFIHEGKAALIASGGTVGENMNKKMKIREFKLPKDSLNDRIASLRIGVERLITLYELTEKD
jgi:aspartyl/asparaginyl-tRNA synthetase